MKRMNTEIKKGENNVSEGSALKEEDYKALIVREKQMNQQAKGQGSEAPSSFFL